jgi:hypothetical protein
MESSPRLLDGRARRLCVIESDRQGMPCIIPSSSTPTYDCCFFTAD